MKNISRGWLIVIATGLLVTFTVPGWTMRGMMGYGPGGMMASLPMMSSMSMLNGYNGWMMGNIPNVPEWAHWVGMALGRLSQLGVLAFIGLGVVWLMHSLATSTGHSSTDPSPLLNCPQCGQRLQAEWKVCPHCGASAEAR